MGAYRLVSLALSGLFLAGGIHLLRLWIRERQPLLLALSVQALASACFTFALLCLTAADSVRGTQVATSLQAGFGVLLLGATTWLLSLVSGVRARWMVVPLTVVFVGAAAAAIAMVPVAGDVPALHAVIAPWGERLWRPVIGAALSVAGNVAGQVVNLFALGCAWRMRHDDRFGATLISVAAVTSAVVLLDVSMAESGAGPGLPASLSMAWVYVALLTILVLRDHGPGISRLVRAEDDYRAIFDQTFQMSVVLSPSGEMLDLNAAAVQAAGGTADALVGRPFWEGPWWSHEADVQRRMRSGVAAAAGGSTTRIQTTYAGTGLTRWADVVLRPLRDREGAVRRVVVEARDTTEERLARAELDREQRQLHGIVQGALEAIITIDERDRIVRFNPAAERMFGHDVDAVLGQRMEVLLPRHLRAEYEDQLRAFLGADAPSLPAPGYVRLVGLRASGEEFPIEVSLSVVHLDDAAYFTVLCRDITERERAEAARRHLEAQLQQAQKLEAVGQLAGGIAHDFNNLLTVINGYSDLLLGAADLAHRRGELQQIRSAGERAASLTRQLLTFSRHAVVEQHVVSLNDVVGQAEHLLRGLLGEDIAVALDLAQALPHIKADRGQLERVLINLVVNARDAMPEGGLLAITTATVDGEGPPVPLPPAPGWVVLAVSDSGVGMPSEVQARLFEPFFTTKPPGQGTGLGLAVVDGVVKKAGGVIRVSSTAGKGTTFSLYFPVSLEAPCAEAATEPVAPARARGETVLVVEDEPAVRGLAVASLEQHGYGVLQACSAAQALEVARGHETPIHLLLSDVVMPGGSAVSIVDGLADQYPGLKVLFMSGYPADEAVRRGVVAGDSNFLQKPFTPTGLVARVRQVLDA
jgi:PAS domain S-box-containing protein